MRSASPGRFAEPEALAAAVRGRAFFVAASPSSRAASERCRRNIRTSPRTSATPVVTAIIGKLLISGWAIAMALPAPLPPPL